MNYFLITFFLLFSLDASLITHAAPASSVHDRCAALLAKPGIFATALLDWHFWMGHLPKGVEVREYNPIKLEEKLMQRSDADGNEHGAVLIVTPEGRTLKQIEFKGNNYSIPGNVFYGAVNQLIKFVLQNKDVCIGTRIVFIHTHPRSKIDGTVFSDFTEEDIQASLYHKALLDYYGFSHTSPRGLGIGWMSRVVSRPVRRGKVVVLGFTLPAQLSVQSGAFSVGRKNRRYFEAQVRRIHSK